jgi:tetratricopeptide (TPR) repeat protein
MNRHTRKRDRYFDLAFQQTHARQFDLAVANYQLGLKIDPRAWKARVALGYCLHHLAKFDEATQQYTIAMKHCPAADVSAIRNNRGLSLQQQMKLDEAFADFDTEDRGVSNFHKSCVYFMRGNYQAGLPIYRPVSKWMNDPEWNVRPVPDVHGKDVRVLEVGGYGDTIMFCRFFPLLKEKARTVQWDSRPATAELIPSIPGADRPDTFITTFDLMVVAGMVEHGLSVVSGKPYIRPRFKRFDIPLRGRRKIGLNWRGNPRNIIDIWRSAPLETLLPLQECGDLYSLQFDPTPQECEMFKAHNIQDMRQTNFSDVASLMDQLDLFVTIESAPAHLAGAIGAPTALLLPFSPAWQWGLEDTIPWYDSIKPYRQTSHGDWSGVVEKLAASLGSC